MGTGVIDPEFFRDLVGPGSVDETCIERWIECLEQFRMVSVRGVESQRTLAAQGFQRATVVGDPALYFARDTITPKRGTKSIGVNVSNYCHFWGHGQEETVRVLTNLISWLTREGWAVTLFPAMPEDHTLSLGIVDALDSERIRIFGNYSDRGGLLDELAAQDLFVGVKLHTVIAACCVYTPAIMLGYQPKCLDFMRTMDLEEYHTRTDRLDLDHLIDMIRMMSGDLESIQRRQFESTQLFRGRLLDFRDRVLESIGMRPTSGEMRPRERSPSTGRLHPTTQGLREKLWAMREAGRTSLRRCKGGSDYRRWSDSRCLSPDWDTRTEQIASLIPPGKTVLEFGAGRMTLKNHLPEGCKYTPSDLVDRGDGTIVCDLNAGELPEFPLHDVAVFSGVLEYINDVEQLIAKLKMKVDMIVASYAVRDQIADKLLRRSCGWVNDYTDVQFKNIFVRLGFRCDHVESWNDQKIYRFVREENALA
jgi:hypothetical protein